MRWRQLETAGRAADASQTRQARPPRRTCLSLMSVRRGGGVDLAEQLGEPFVLAFEFGGQIVERRGVGRLRPQRWLSDGGKRGNCPEGRAGRFRWLIGTGVECGGGIVLWRSALVGALRLIEAARELGKDFVDRGGRRGRPRARRPRRPRAGEARDRGRRSADAEARTDCELYVLSRREFNSHIHDDAVLGVRIFARIARAVSLRLRQTDSELSVIEDR